MEQPKITEEHVLAAIKGANEDQAALVAKVKPRLNKRWEPWGKTRAEARLNWGKRGHIWMHNGNKGGAGAFVMMKKA